MAREETFSCDICQKQTQRILFKLFLSPAGRIHKNKAPHSNYTHHLDVGECCGDKLLTGFRWSSRISAEQYRARRKKHASK